MPFIKKTAVVITAFLSMLTTCNMTYSSALDENTVTVKQLSSETTGFYEEWKDKYLAQNTYVTDEIQYYVWYSGENYQDNSSETAVTVSEAHGYGMLITACMAEYDSDAKEIFDGMYRYYKAHPSEIGPNLMAWQQSDNGTAIVDSSGADSATDGDMDIAYSLLIADSVWGSSGDINYKQSAIDVINDIMKYEVNKTDWILQLGDWAYWTDEGDEFYAATRSSDFIVQYMPVFAEAAGDDRWLNVYEGTYEIINSFINEYKTGILPDFIIKDSSGKFVPAPENFIESEYDGYYSYNSCRTPWRVCMDYLINGSKDALSFAEAINSFITESTGGDPWEIKAGYKPDGTPVEDYNDLCFTAPFLIAAACGENTEWHSAVRDTVINYGEDVYYGDTIKMLCLIADDGGWIVPEASDIHKLGDINLDGTVNTLDAELLQVYLVNKETLNAEQGNNADLDSSGVVNVFDLVLLKRQIL